MRILILTMALALAACGVGMTAEQRVEKARDYLAADNAPAAIIELKNALQDDPVNLEARLLLAEASFKAGDPQTAVKEYERALDLGADLEPIRIAYAEVLVRTRRAEKALELADPVGAPPAEQARVQWIRGLALTALGRFDAAEAALAEARKDSQQAFAADIATARLELARGDAPGARSVLDRIAAAGEQKSEYWEVLGHVQLDARDPGAAAQSFEKAARLADEPFGGRRFILSGSRAEALLADGDVAKAREVAERLYREARQHPLPNYLMSRVEYQSGNYQQALAYAQALLSLQPGSPIGNVLAGAASLAMNQPAQAENYLARAVDAEPENATARKLLAQVRLGLGSPQDALATLRPVAGLDAEAARWPAWLSIRAGDPAAAIELFRGELAADPDNEQLRLQLAVSLMAAGRNDEALAELGRMIKGWTKPASCAPTWSASRSTCRPAICRRRAMHRAHWPTRARGCAGAQCPGRPVPVIQPGRRCRCLVRGGAAG
jgi:cellulose synthase operon protein C